MLRHQQGVDFMDDELAKQIETKNFVDSKVHQYIGSNVKSPSLIKGNSYIIKFWSAKSTPDSDNPYWIGQFCGAGTTIDNIIEPPLRAKEMTVDQRFFFRRVNGDVVSASNNMGALVVNSDVEQRITFYGLNTEAQQNADKIDAPKVKLATVAAANASKTAPVKLTKPVKAAKQRVARAERATDNYTPEQNSELLRSIRKNYLKESWRVAQFRTKEEAESFAKKSKHCAYVRDGIFNIVEIRLENDAENTFFGSAKQAGAFECYNHTKLVLQ
jgi:hypothetical protein